MNIDIKIIAVNIRGEINVNPNVNFIQHVNFKELKESCHAFIFEENSEGKIEVVFQSLFLDKWCKVDRKHGNYKLGTSLAMDNIITKLTTQINAKIVEEKRRYFKQTKKVILGLDMVSVDDEDYLFYK